MAGDTDASVKRLIAQHAVVEQIVLNMLAVMSGGLPNPKEFREALLDDVRSRFTEAANGPAGEGKADFARLALDHVGQIAERISQWRGDETVQ
ncbi:MAG: hypothetical protein K8H74_04420 [Notoacmeibacter sp.]|nr:hypothetical protein [Notoacmeibacter sp.]